MAVLHISALLLVAVSMVSCEVDCPYGRYWDPDSDDCQTCSPCPRDVILGTSQDFGAIYHCSRYKSLCPNWCSVSTRPLSNPKEGKDSCPPMTPSPPVPYVNVTIEEPLFNATTNAYTASCTIFFSNMDTPSLKWYNPLGQLLAPTDTSGKWNVTMDAVTQGVMLANLQIKDFQEEDEGNYTCSAQGEQSANQTIFLKYVEPAVTTSTPSPSTAPPNMAPPSTTPEDSPMVPKATSDKSAAPRDGISITNIVVIAVAVVGVCLLCGFGAFYVNRYVMYRRNRASLSRSDIESHLLTGTNVMDGLTLEASDDFKSATVVGIQTCFCQYNCPSVIIKHKKKNHKVQSGQNKFFIEHMAWNDSIEVYVKYSGKKEEKKRIKILKMNCLKIENITETSAVVRCPSDEDTFYCHFEEQDASGGSSNRESGELVRGGSKQINLRPQMTYCVHLGVRGRTGDSGPINWVWKETFETKSIKFNKVSPDVSSATLRLTGHSIPGSVQLYYVINGSDPKQMTSTETQISSLIPGMHQLLQIKIKEDIEGSTNYRLLKKIPFKTTGSLKDGGDYKGYATTDFPSSDPDDEPGPSTFPARKKSRKRQSGPLRCNTGLLEAIHALRDRREYQQVYFQTPQSVLEAVMDSLVEFLKDFKDIVPSVRPNLSNTKGLVHIESFIKQFAMQDYTGIFDLLKRFIQKPEAHSPEGISLAECLLAVHYRRCHICDHAVYILKSDERKDIHPSSEC